MALLACVPPTISIAYPDLPENIRMLSVTPLAREVLVRLTECEVATLRLHAG